MLILNIKLRHQAQNYSCTTNFYKIKWYAFNWCWSYWAQWQYSLFDGWVCANRSMTIYFTNLWSPASKPTERRSLSRYLHEENLDYFEGEEELDDWERIRNSMFIWLVIYNTIVTCLATMGSPWKNSQKAISNLFNFIVTWLPSLHGCSLRTLPTTMPSACWRSTVLHISSSTTTFRWV